MGRGRITALTAAAGMCAGLLAFSPAPSSAQVPTDHTVLAGNFAAGPRDELFYYAPGSEAEGLFVITMSGDAPMIELRGEFTVNGTYTPLVGDFDGDGFDEILWYAPGSTQDYMWNFTSYTTIQSRSYPVNGTYTPTVGDYTADGADDILWYAPGSQADYLWDYNTGGGYASHRQTINGVYKPVSGSVAQDATDDIFWYAPGTAADYIWDYPVGGGTPASIRQTVNGGGYLPFSLDVFADGAGNEDLFWYAPGTSPDSLWDYYFGSRFTYAEYVDGEYVTTSGDFFGDGAEDIVFENDTELLLYEHRLVPGGVERWEWLFGTTPEAAADSSVMTEDGSGTTAPPRLGELVGETTITRP